MNEYIGKVVKVRIKRPVSFLFKDKYNTGILTCYSEASFEIESNGITYVYNSYDWIIELN